MRTGDRTPYDDGMGTEEHALHRIFRGIDMAFHEHIGFLRQFTAEIGEHPVIRPFDVGGFLGVAIQGRGDDVGAQSYCFPGFFDRGDIGEDRDVGEFLLEFRQQIDRATSVLIDLERTIHGDDIAARFDDVAGALQGRGDEDIGVVEPHLIQSDQGKFDFFLDLADLFRSVGTDADRPRPLGGLGHDDHHLIAVDDFIGIGLAGYDQATLHFFNHFILFHYVFPPKSADYPSHVRFAEAGP